MAIVVIAIILSVCLTHWLCWHWGYSKGSLDGFNQINELDERFKKMVAKRSKERKQLRDELRKMSGGKE